MPRTSKQLEEIKEASRENILAAALELFAKRGPFATSIGDIAKKAGISNGLAYHYFPSKEDIFAVLLQRAVARFDGALQKLTTMPLTPDAKIKFLSRFMLETISEEDRTASYFMIMMQASLSDEFAEKLQEQLETAKRPIGMIAKVVSDGQIVGVVCEGAPMKLATTYWSAIQGICMYRIIQGEDFVIPDATMLNRILLV